MKIVDSGKNDLGGALAVIREKAATPPEVEEAVRGIIEDVRTRGDRAVREYTRRFDGVDTRRFRVSAREINRALKKTPKEQIKLLEMAAGRIEAFHRRQVENSWFTASGEGTILGTMVTPIERAALYVPGGKAAYPSTVLMNAIPARVAGVAEVYVTTPPSKDGIPPLVLAAAVVAGVGAVFRVGGAQAVAAFAFGTESVPQVDKITGPGNIFVATAKKLVFGTVDIDMVAGPSEILIVNDGTGPAAWIASDLLGQAEHDEMASSILVTTSKKMARAVRKEVETQLRRLRPAARRAIAEKALADNGLIITVENLDEAMEIANTVAPEHLELFVERPLELLGRIRNAGAVFLGPLTPEAAGDYMAGPNHTLPTGGTARFSSPLGVYDFVKRTSVIGFTKEGLKSIGPAVETFARIEGLTAHGESVRKRIKKS